MSCLDKHHILEIEDLTIRFTQYEKGMHQRELEVIHDLHVSVHDGELVAVIGSSGSGKSLLAHAVLGLLPNNATVRGRIYFDEELLTAERIAELRGKQIVLVPQSVAYLDPLQKVGLQTRGGRRDKKSKQRQSELYEAYQLSSSVADLYPFELSGGMARRVLLTTALMESPRLIIADEPTPGLDPSLAKKALRQFREFADRGNGVLLITHDIELALEVADRIAVFYAGTTLEEAKVEDFQHEETLRHPYTKALWRALPQNGFQTLAGAQPFAADVPTGCPFGPRCAQFDDECLGEIPVKIVRCGTVRCVHSEPGEQHEHHHTQKSGTPAVAEGKRTHNEFDG